MKGPRSHKSSRSAIADGAVAASPSKKRQRLVTATTQKTHSRRHIMGKLGTSAWMSMSGELRGEHGLSNPDYLSTSQSQLSLDATSQQSTEFIEKMENMMSKFSQGSSYSIADHEFLLPSSEGTRDGFASSAPIGFKPRLNFYSQDSACSVETTPIDTSGDSFDVFGARANGSLRIDVPHSSFETSESDAGPCKQNSFASKLASEEAHAAPLEKESSKDSPNPFLPQASRRASTFAAAVTPRDTSVFSSRYEREFTLGCGAFAEVSVARNRLEGTLYAVKRVRAHISNDRMKRRVLHEVHALSVLRGCPCAIQYFDSWFDQGNLYICTELCLKENLLSFLSYGGLLTLGLGFFESGPSEALSAGTPRFSVLSFDEYECSTGRGGGSQRQINATGGGIRGLHRNLSTASGGASFETPPPGGYKISEQLAWIIIEDIGAALAFMHLNGIAHLDIKPGNIFIAPSSYFELEALYSRLRSVTEYTREHYLHLIELEPKLVARHWRLKLGDFGNCCALNAWTSNKEEGDTRYCAEELISSENPDLARADVFSLGATVYELCTGALLPDSQDGSETWRDLRNGRLQHFNGYSSGGSAGAAQDAVMSMMGDDDGDRDASAPKTARRQFSRQLTECIQKMMSCPERARPRAADLRREHDWSLLECR